MQVAVFSESYEPIQNGVSTSVRTLVEGLQDRGHGVTVVAPHFPTFRHDKMNVIRVPSVLTPFDDSYRVPTPWIPNFRRVLSQHRPDVLHAQLPWSLGILASRISARDGYPLVASYHTFYEHYGHYVFFLPKQTLLSFLQWWMPEYYNRCDVVITPSEAAKQRLRVYGVHSHVEVIPTAAPIPNPDSVSAAQRIRVRQLLGIPNDATIMLYVGRLAQEKNIELLISAFEIVSHTVDKLRLVLVGTGPHEPHLRSQCEELPMGDRIIFAGPVARDDLDPYYAAADVFVMASETETQGLVIAEAKAAGLPSTVVNSGGAQESVQNAVDGFVVDAEPRAFSEALRRLLCNEDLRHQMRLACIRNSKSYVPEHMLDRVIEVYRRAKEVHQRPDYVD